MDFRNKVAKYSLISTIMQGITLFFIIGVMIMSVVLVFYLGGFIGDSAGLTENINPDDVTAGWAVLFGAAGSVIGVLAGVVLIFLIIMLIGPLIAGIVVLIYGIRTYKKRDSADFARRVKNDSIIKLTINAVAIVLLVVSVISSESNTQTLLSILEELVKVMLFTLPSIVSVIVSIAALKNIDYIEELPEESEYQYMEYNEDKSPYFGQ